MLRSLKIRNYAIIRQSEIHFHKGLSIITGETGAGKSILMGALGLILGERADSKVILEGADKCIVEAQFEIESYHLTEFFEQNELDYEPLCIIRRELNSAGKSRAFINDTPVNLPILKELGLNLVDIVSQHETLELNESKFQLEVLDLIAKTQVEKSNYLAAFKEFGALKRKLQSLKEQEAQSKKDEDYLKFVLNELIELNPKIGEQEELEKKLDELSHAETIQQASLQASNMLDGSENAVVDILRELKNSLSTAAKHQETVKSLLPRIEGNLLDLKDISMELLAISDKTLSDPKLLAHIEERLQLIYSLLKKHRVQTLEELLTLKEEFDQRLQSLGSLENEIEKTLMDLEKAEKVLLDAGLGLRDKRKSSLSEINTKVNELLVQVAMPNAIFDIQFVELAFEKANADGMDEITFLFSANKGFSAQPINKVASGGELSRLMLCIKSLIADQVKLPSVVFDEIDSGISGEAAQKVAAVMRKHASSHQVIAISHLPQIAGKADQHLYVYKSNEGEQTQTAIRALNKEERVLEIARMLSGENPSEKVLAAAKELIGNLGN
ncbi:MAG: DNA repair protein RecN [Bacteroidetes bacterium B1(2017)]|nr:MAG: DNA repair protein RecN [Bacteroidetes bacterium B1(2017)]